MSSRSAEERLAYWKDGYACAAQIIYAAAALRGHDEFARAILDCPMPRAAFSGAVKALRLRRAALRRKDRAAILGKRGESR